MCEDTNACVDRLPTGPASERGRGITAGEEIGMSVDGVVGSPWVLLMLGVIWTERGDGRINGVCISIVARRSSAIATSYLTYSSWLSEEYWVLSKIT